MFEEAACSYSVDPIDLEGADSEEANLVLCEPEEDKIREKDEYYPILTITEVPNPENATNSSSKQMHLQFV